MRMSRTIGWRTVVVLTLAMAVLAAWDAGAAGRAKRIMLVGDSWPFFMWRGSLAGVGFWEGCAAQDGLDAAGYSDWDVWGEYSTLPGSLANAWRENVAHSYWGRVVGILDTLRLELEAYPNIDIVHLSLGGNDMGRGNYSDVMPQQIRFTGTPTGGTFTLAFEGATTGSLSYDATAAEIQAALQSLSTIGTGNVQVTGPVGGPFWCSFADSVIPFNTDSGDYYISPSSSLVGGGMMVDEAHDGWQKSWGTDSDYEKLFFRTLCDAIEPAITTVLNVRPDIRVVLCDYDYLVTDWGGATEFESRQAGTRMGAAKYDLTQRISAMPAYSNRCFFLCPGGLMQYVFGLYSRYKCFGNQGPAAGATLLYGPMGTAGTEGTITRPESNPVPVAGGDIDPPVDYYANDSGDSHYQHTHDISPRTVLLCNVSGDIHLNKTGYAALMQYGVEEFYGEWLDYPKVIAAATKGKSLDPNEARAKGVLAEVTFTVTFSEAVTGVDPSDFSVLTRGGRTGGFVVSVEPGPTDFSETYDVTVNVGTGSGQLTVAVIDNGTILDQTGDPLAGNVDGYYAYGEWYDPVQHSLPVAAWPAALVLAGAGLALLGRRSRA